MHTTITITGMTCASCADSIQATLNALPGVEAEVSYDQGRAVVTRPGEVGTERLLETIRAKGYGAELTQAAERTDGSLGSEQGLHIAVIGSGEPPWQRR
ncbi:cation transporter [Modicisalibacter luteus]